jgi:hypothetical protein
MPFRENSYVPTSKLVDYLLSDTHPEGSKKAKVFHRFGFANQNFTELESKLLHVAKTANVSEVDTSSDGTKYIFKETIQTPSGRPLRLCMVWMIDKGEETPRFITAYPLEVRHV